MNLRYWPRHHPSKGVSTVAGAIFFVVILITIMTGLVFWSISTQREMGDLEARRLSQNLSISVNFTSPTTINITVRNNGPEAVELVALWITNTTYHRRIDLSGQGVVIGPGEEWTYTANLAWTPGSTYVIKVVTSLGRVFATSATAP